MLMMAIEEKDGLERATREIKNIITRSSPTKQTEEVKRFVIEYSCIKKKTIFARDEKEAIKMLTMNLEDETVTEMINVQSFKDCK